MLMHTLLIQTLLAAAALSAVAPQDPPSTRVAPAPADPATHPTAPALSKIFYSIAEWTGRAELDEMAAEIVADTTPSMRRSELLEVYVARMVAGGTQHSGDALVDGARQLIQPPLSGEENRIEQREGRVIVVTGSDEQQRWIDDYLTELRQFEGLVETEAQVLRLPPGGLAALTGGRSGRVMTRAEFDDALARVTPTETVAAPRVATRPPMGAQLSVIDQRAYIRDFEVRVISPDMEVVDPVVDVLETGLRLDLRAVPLPGGRLAMHVDVTYSSAEEPFSEHVLRIGTRAVEVTVQLPEVDSLNVKGAFELGPGSVIVMGAPDGREGGDTKGDLVVMVAARRVASPSAAPPTGVDAPR